MAYQAELQSGNHWIVIETDEQGTVVEVKTVFCNQEHNTEADAIALASYEPAGD
jgi:hypothetical protein